MEVSDEDIKQAYDQRRASFTTPERRHVEQIVFPTLADAQAAADRIKSGAHFGEIASDRGLKDQDIDLGTIPKSRIVEPTVADAAFSLKEGEVSAPLQTRFGAALVTVPQIVPETTQSLAEATARLRSDIALERAKTQVQNLHDKVEDDRAGGSTVEEAAAKLKLPVATYEVDRSGRGPDGKPLPNIPHGADLVKAAFASDVGVDNDPIDADGGYIWYDVAAIAPARERTLDEVKAEVEQRWRDDEVASQLKNKAGDMIGKLNSGEKLAALASADGLKIQSAKNIKRGTASGGVSARMADAAFQTAKDAYGSVAGDSPSQWIVFRVLEVNTPALDANSPDHNRMTQSVQRELSADLIGQYVAQLEDDLGTSVNASVLAQATGNSPPDAN
jgi:peptidyl-prolyl cis-trans isomerase D